MGVRKRSRKCVRLSKMMLRVGLDTAKAMVMAMATAVVIALPPKGVAAVFLYHQRLPNRRMKATTKVHLQEWLPLRRLRCCWKRCSEAGLQGIERHWLPR